MSIEFLIACPTRDLWVRGRHQQWRGLGFCPRQAGTTRSALDELASEHFWRVISGEELYSVAVPKFAAGCARIDESRNCVMRASGADRV
jgi:hypothetical protein